MAILKYGYLSLGLILFIFINIVSYTHQSYQADLLTKIIFTSISFVLLIIDYAIILFTKKIFKKIFQHLQLI